MEPTLSTLPQGIVDLIDRGYGFYYNTGAAGVVAAAVGTASAPMLWNPSDSDVNLKIVKIKFGVVSGTVILSHLAYGIFKAGAQIGTAQPVVSYTAGAPTNAKYGAGRVSRINFAPLTVSMTGGPSYWMPSGLNAGGAFAAGTMFPLIDPVDGCIVIPPGIAFFPYVSNAAMALTAAVSVLGLELPVSTAIV
jgi:hypothetical protein